MCGATLPKHTHLTTLDYVLVFSIFMTRFPAPATVSMQMQPLHTYSANSAQWFPLRLGQQFAFGGNRQDLSGYAMTSLGTVANNQRALDGAKHKCQLRGRSLRVTHTDTIQPVPAVQTATTYTVTVPTQAIGQTDTAPSAHPNQPIITYYNVSRKQQQSPQFRGAGPPRRQQQP